ncbi:hypothetical protein OSB04_018519 [Centaurea solstitialis]|uniref:TIR domain-containing protein n=1 Tax=Centaurea solstitialis TaxID=347529 RepID=A0AA38T514_9ASTR|nr:hypothetical protein OSB04_018519 [Centaurea solstitialis]
MASSSSSSFHSTPPSSSSSQLLEYDVFLSFRGTDTRNTFIDHLYSALCHRAIHTYKDDVTLPRGETIDTALLTAIEKSHIAVIIFSENYADSSWCLQELAHIMKCKDERGLTVMPIFYHIDPSELRNQKGKYGEALAKHESENKKVELWRKALVDARKLSGYVANGSKPETVFIKEIVDEISKRLPVAISSDNEDLVGIGDRLQDLKSEMEKVSDRVVMVGIWGCGGAGKTTLASGLYDQISAKFEVCCFVENIREKSSISDGLQKLQSDILSHVSNQKPVNRVVDGRRLIKDGFFRKKVLIVLDDVDHLDQLQALAGSPDWFGEGSRIIITTRDEHLLKAHKVNHIYNISLLDANEGMKLFRKHAPQDGRPLEEYEKLSKEVVSYAGGLPLALKVLGSFLCDKDMSAWRSALARLKEIPESGIMEKLKISYDGLKPIEKELFLDIACFFRRDHKDYAIQILDAFGFHPIIGVNVLIQKALITVSKYGMFDMHDLIQEMGHHIVREENPNNPELHSRVWQWNDVVKICNVDATKENDRIQALKVWDFLDNDSPPNLPQVVGNMKKLRSFDTHGYGETSLPTEFQPTNLCYLGLIWSNVKQLWEGNKLDEGGMLSNVPHRTQSELVLPNLKVINLTCSEDLVKTPDFNGLPCLERLILTSCESLKEIHPSIGYHERLNILDMGHCTSLEFFPPIIRMKNLKTLLLDGCSELCKFPYIQKNMDNLVELSLRRSGIEVVPSSIGEYCTNLRSLDLGYCNHLQSIEGNFHRLKHLNVLHLYGCDQLNNIPAEGLFDVDCCLQLLSSFRNLHRGMLNPKLFGFPSSLTRLDLSYCGLEDGDLSSVFCKELSNLQALDLRGNHFSQLHSSLLQLPRLKYLNLSGCKSLVELPDLPSSIAILIAEQCSSLVIKGDFPTNLKWLWNVFLSGKKCNVDHILQSMLQGNAIEDHYMSIRLDGPYIPRRGLANEVFTLQLPGNWKIEFSGFLVYVYGNKLRRRHQEVIMIEEVKGMENKGDILEDEDEEEEEEGMCYISFVSLKDTSWWKSIHTTISFSISKCRLGVELVPKRSQGDDLTERPKDPTYISEFWDKQSPYSKTFDITNDSKSSIGIEWDFSNTYSELFERLTHFILKQIHPSSMASSSSSSFHSTPPSSSSSQLLEYDVFLSFRGTDTRNTFIDHLYSALCHRAIHTYKDDVTLPRGETIDTALLTAIEKSHIAVIIFSENYADSSWCLQELAHIMKCKDERGLTVMPIFYHIDPSELRNQKGKYGEALAKHESENKKVELWRKALVDARKLSGYVANGSKPETVFIKEIVDEISKRLPVAISSDNEDLVGIGDRLQDLKSEMEKVSDRVVMVGIWGCGGAGKTTLASGLYDQISAKFEVCCFVENIREKSSISDGLQKLQSDILSHVSNQKPVNRVVDGRRLIKDGFFRKKVLIVLDDVDHLDQLQALAGSPDWFGEGSRIIITTRDEHLLKAHKVNHIYNISLLDANEGMKLFRKHAPQDGRPLEEYEKLSKEVVSYAGGLPLALKVLGSFLCDKDMSAWRSALARLKEIPESGIMEKLKISYDGLKPIEKELFLDIACFFRRDHKDYAIQILDAFGFHPIIGVNVLIQKALITVSKYGMFDMHDLIQEMGHHIVREENPNNPELHSRVWQWNDVVKICNVDATKENDRIQALKVWDFLDNDSPPNLPQVVGNMKKLRSFDTHGYGETSLPTEFQPTNLCYLGLIWSNVKQLWEGNKLDEGGMLSNVPHRTQSELVLPNLKVINLTCSEDLVKTPDFNGLPCLERLILTSCESLKEIHPSIGYHERLNILDMGHCTSLEFFPPIIRMKNLKTLLLDGCSELCKFPYIQKNMDNLVELSLRRSGIEVVPSSIGEYCTNLRSLDLGYCNHLQSIEGNFHRLKHLNVLHLYGCDQLNNIPAEGLFDVDCCLQLLSSFRNLHRGMLNPKLFGFPSSLTRLDLSYCGLEDGDLSSVFCKELSNLQALDLRGNHFSQLHSSLLQLPRLKYLNLSGCKSLVELPDLPSSIAILIAEQCSSLVIKGDFPTNLKWLWNVFLSGKKCNVDHILQSMLQGNAIEDHYMSIRLDGPYIPRRGLANEVFTLQLPGNWKIEFSGFLVYVYGNKLRRRHQEVIMIEEVKGMENKGDILEDEDEEEEEEGMCYISFVSLKDTSWWKSIHTTISFSISKCRLGVELVPKRSQGDDLTERPKDPTYISEFWDKQSPYSKTFDITNDSKSSIGIEWDFSNTYSELFERLYEVVNCIQLNKQATYSDKPF